MLTERDLKAIDDNWTEACHAVNRRSEGRPFSVEAIVQSATDVPLLYDMVRDLQGWLEDREAKIESLQAAVRRHRDERGDDRCWMDDERLYDEALPEGCGDRADRRLHCPEEMMRHCQQFIASRQPEGEPYVSPQREIDRLRAALEKVNEIRNSIIGLQTVNWSEHVYPLVKVLDETGFEGMAYPDATAHYGTMLDRTLAAEAACGRLQGIVNEATTTGIEIADIAEKEILRLRAALERIACRDQGEVGPHLEEPRAAIAREVLG